MCDLKKLLGIALLFYLPQCLCMEPKDGCELTEVKVVVDDDSNTDERVSSLRRPVVEQRRSASLNEMDGSPHNSPRHVSPRSSALEKRRSVSEADLFNINPDELAERAAQITLGIGNSQFHAAKELCSQEFAKMSPKKPKTFSQQPSQKKKNSMLKHKIRRQTQHERERQEDIDQSVVPSFGPEYARAFQNLATAPQDELCKRSSTAVNVSKWMFAKVFEARSQAIEAEREAIEAEREAVREKEKTARMKNLFGFLAAIGGGGVTVLTAVLAYSSASSNHCDPCEICDVCQNIVNGTINS